jgi:hypothetical protein
MPSLGTHIQEQYTQAPGLNRAPRAITGADRYTRITQLHEMLNLDTIQTTIKHLAHKTKETCTHYNNSLIQHIRQSHHSTILHYTKPTQIIQTNNCKSNQLVKYICRGRTLSQQNKISINQID